MKRLQRSKAALREASAMLRQARYLGLDWSTKRSEQELPQVVLLHGLYASAGVFRPLRQELEQRFELGISSFSYFPGPGIVELTARLQSLIAKLPVDSPVILIGHSLGGLVMRHYVRQADANSRVVQTISLAAPFRGSAHHQLVPGQAGLDLRPDSPILLPLRTKDELNLRVPHLTIVAEEDRLIEQDPFPQYGEYRVVSGAGHNGILFAGDAISAVVERLRRLVQVSDGPGSHQRL